jgi:transcriptional regulator GlxA family with amidase domain
MVDKPFKGYVSAMKPITIHVLALEDCTALVPIGLVDLLRKSSMLATSARVPRLDISLVSSTKSESLLASGGVRLSCDACIREVRRSDLVILPALDPDVIAHLEQNRDVVPWLRRIFLGGADVAAACTGAFLLAEAGLLDGRSATTHWAFQSLFSVRYPKVRLEPEAIVVDQGRVLTSGGATSFLSLSLYLVERLLGAEIARAASKMFLVDVNKAPQIAYAVFSPQKEHGDDDILRAQAIMEKELARADSLEDIARRVAMSHRNFVRRFKAATGNTPREYVQRARVEAAKRELERTRRSIASVAREVGYEDVVAFRKLFVRWTGLTPADYRTRYGQRTAPTLIADRPRWTTRAAE